MHDNTDDGDILIVASNYLTCMCQRERDRVHCCFPFMALNSSLLSHVIILFLLFLCSLIHIFLWSDVMMMMLIV